MIKGGQLGHFIGGTTLAVSPDGSQVATVVYHTVGRHSPRPVPQIMVINLRTQGSHGRRARPPQPAPGHSVSQNLRVVRVPLRGAGGARLLYRGVLGPHPAVSLRSDASGRHLLLAWARNGWIDHGRLRLLPPQGGAALTDAW